MYHANKVKHYYQKHEQSYSRHGNIKFPDDSVCFLHFTNYLCFLFIEKRSQLQCFSYLFQWQSYVNINRSLNSEIVISQIPLTDSLTQHGFSANHWYRIAMQGDVCFTLGSLHSILFVACQLRNVQTNSVRFVILTAKNTFFQVSL